MTGDAVEAAGSVLIGVSLLETVGWAATYHVLTGGDWRRSAAGRHLMAFTASLGAILALAVVKALATAAGLDDPGWFRWLRLGVFGTYPIVMAWRWVLLLRAQTTLPPAGGGQEGSQP